MHEEELEELKEELREVFSGYNELAGGRNYRYHHQLSVRKYSLKIADEVTEGREIDRKVLEISALFHDLGRSDDIEDGFLDPFQGHENHPRKGAEMVGDHIAKYVSESELREIRRIIENHHSEPETKEGRILQDADLLYKYGVQDLWRMFHYAYQNEKEIGEVRKNFREVLEDRLEDRLEEFFFDFTREKAEERLEKERRAISTFEKHREGEDL